MTTAFPMNSPLNTQLSRKENLVEIEIKDLGEKVEYDIREGK